jgi:hypothetical protein
MSNPTQRRTLDEWIEYVSEADDLSTRCARLDEWRESGIVAPTAAERDRICAMLGLPPMLQLVHVDPDGACASRPADEALVGVMVDEPGGG